MKSIIQLNIILSLLFISIQANGQTTFKWPETPSSMVFQNFLKAYNIGQEAKVEHFVRENYMKTSKEYIYNKVDGWMDLYYRYGEIEPKIISINEPYDIEIWAQGKFSRNWFAIEFLLDPETSKVKAVGILQGALPEGAAIGSENEISMLGEFKRYLLKNEEKNLLQGAVLLQKGNEVLINQGFGYKNINNAEKNEPETRFDICSITKTITSVACLQLVQQGLLGLETSIDNYLPELPKHIASQITIKMLLSHTSAYELDGIDGFREDLEKTSSMSEVYQLQLRYLPQWEHYHDFKVEKKYDYANDSFDLVAIIIEKITAMKFEEYLKTYIFDRLGMTSTSYEMQGAAARYRYDLSVKRLMDFSKYYPYQMAKISGAGGLISTTKDLKLFFEALLHSNLLLDYPHRSLIFSPFTKEMSASNVLPNPNTFIEGAYPIHYNSYGLGMRISYDARLNVGHDGTGIGSSSEMRYFPNSGYLLIVLCNNRNGAKNVYNFFKNHLPRN